MSEIDGSLPCCPERAVVVARIVIADIDAKNLHNIARSRMKLSENVVSFKALSKRNGTDRILRKSVFDSVEIQTKASRIGSTLRSLAIPGDSDPIRSPVRSAIYRTLTPGKPGGVGGSKPGQNRGYRCPEGYQYGGRFTDSRLSTCGAKLFDIPSPLRMLVAALRRAGRGPAKPEPVTGKPLTGGDLPGNLIESRKPQIPKVSLDNPRSAAEQVKGMVSEIGGYNGKATRMVRRDGFVLEPVVPAKVLRAIPDNRDMEGATYILSALSPDDIGNDELGLLSNTGVKSLVYVLPGGSTITLEKARKLSVGERRKLGRTVNTAIESQSTSDPASKLKMVADETGDGIRYSENFIGLKNPNEIVKGKFRWATEAFSGKRRPKAPAGESAAVARQSSSNAQTGKKITSLEAAIEHISAGGSISMVSAEIMPKLLSNSKLIQERKLANNQSLLTIGADKYFLYSSPDKYQHLAERFASDVQQHLGLQSPDVIFADKPSDKRRYIREDVETALKGAKFSPDVKFSDLKPEDVATIMISDFLTDQRDRPSSSIYPLTTPEGAVPMLAQNVTSGLVDLDKIQISKRTKMTIAGFYQGSNGARYSEYYNNLKQDQQVAYRKHIEALLKRARSFKMNELRRRFEKDGLSAGEKTHLSIVETLYKNRLETLSNSKRSIVEVLKGGTNA
jgi:hypothetical protein